MTSPDHERVRDAYAAVADRYVAALGSVDHVHPDDLRFLQRHLAGVAGPVLDVGCGPGHLTGWLRGLGVDATGVDPVPGFVEHARRTHPRVPFEVGALPRLGRPDASVAGVLAWYSLVHLDPDDLDAALVELRRVCAPGAVLVVGAFAADPDDASAGTFPHRVVTAHRWPLRELVHRLARAGFRTVEHLRRPQDGDRRPHLALAAVAVAGGPRVDTNRGAHQAGTVSGATHQEHLPAGAGTDEDGDHGR